MCFYRIIYLKIEGGRKRKIFCVKFLFIYSCQTRSRPSGRLFLSIYSIRRSMTKMFMYYDNFVSAL